MLAQPIGCGLYLQPAIERAGAAQPGIFHPISQSAVGAAPLLLATGRSLNFYRNVVVVREFVPDANPLYASAGGHTRHAIFVVVINLYPDVNGLRAALNSQRVKGRLGWLATHTNSRLQTMKQSAPW